MCCSSLVKNALIAGVWGAALFAGFPACSSNSAVYAAQPNAAPLDGIGSTLGGCPAAEPIAGASGSIQGRLCTWTRACATEAGAAQTTDTGWCTAGGVWSRVAGICEFGCPATQPHDFGSQFGPPPNDFCIAGLTCYYPSTPLQTGGVCTCESAGAGATVWPQTCDAWDDGWVPAPAISGSGACTELAICGGSSGCDDSCPSAAPKSCSCGPDGRMYCQIGPAC